MAQEASITETQEQGVAASLKSRYYFSTKTLTKDIVAGLALGIESVPDGLAQGLLAMVNPVYGLYGYMVGTFTGALFTSSVFMAVQATGAMSLIVASVPQVTSGENADASLWALAILTGLVMLIAGLLRLGSMLRFVPNSVMTGMLNAVAVLIILGQLDDLTGYASSGANKVAKAFDLLKNLDQVVLPNLMVGIATILLILALEKTRLGPLAMVAAIIVASLLVPLAGWDVVEQVSDIADVPSSLPRPVLPPLSVLAPLVVPALSLAFVGLVQGAGVSKSYANPDGQYPDLSGDFVGQGAANLLSGLFQGMPVGGSLSATSLSINAGARTRFANIFAGITMAVVILLFGESVGYIALPAIAGLLIVVGFRTLKPAQMERVWNTGPVERAIMVITFAFCLFIPLQYAVLVGVALAGLLFLVKQSNKVIVKQWIGRPDRMPVEQEPPEAVPPDQVTGLIIYGSVFFATASLVEEQLPTVTEDTRRAVVLLHLQGEEDLGSTFIGVLEHYATSLKEHESKLMLSGVNAHLKDQLNQTEVAQSIGWENVFLYTGRIGESAVDAWNAAQRWLVQKGVAVDEAGSPASDDETPDTGTTEVDAGGNETEAEA
jgi:SulP family sulfate permease